MEGELSAVCCTGILGPDNYVSMLTKRDGNVTRSSNLLGQKGLYLSIIDSRVRRRTTSTQLSMAQSRFSGRDSAELVDHHQLV